MRMPLPGPQTRTGAVADPDPSMAGTTEPCKFIQGGGSSGSRNCPENRPRHRQGGARTLAVKMAVTGEHDLPANAAPDPVDGRPGKRWNNGMSGGKNKTLWGVVPTELISNRENTFEREAIFDPKEKLTTLVPGHAMPLNLIVADAPI